jgi:hypothetical protein
MLSAEDTELLCRVGAGTLRGDLMRQYWMPVAYAPELPPDGQPMRVCVLGEDLLAWPKRPERFGLEPPGAPLETTLAASHARGRNAPHA